MRYATPKLDARTRFNRAVLEILERDHPAHATALRGRGTSLGWWHTADYGRTSGRTPAETAAMIAASKLD